MSEIKLIDKILNEAKQEAAGERAASAVKVDKIIKKASAKADEILKQADDYAKKEAVERARRVKSVYDLEHKKDILAMKREVLDIAFEKAVDDFAAMEDKHYCDIMKNLLISCVSDKKGQVIVSKNDVKRLNNAFIKSVNDKIGANVTILDKTCDKKGGFIYLLDGMEMNCSIESVVAFRREGIETDVAGILFSEDKGE